MKLSDRVEQFDGPCREVDAEIAVAIGWICIRPRSRSRHGIWAEPGYKPSQDGTDCLKDPYRYTASLDAAMSLVPEGAGLNLSRYWIGSVDTPVWSAEICTGGVPENPRKVFDCYDAPTPALALCAAALRARGL